MLLTVAQRLGRSLLVVLLVTMGSVGLLSLAPGSAAAVMLGENATPEQIADLEHRLGLDKPVWEQYLSWLGNAV
ncbi:ABC transporter permease, partial [Frankia sp. CNm7]|nr:ABC transporter permease [Frankia nepalensis]MBL7516389.1 ABC transporter permease [Frankia nepalensis]MBL7517898.1 ABC transporter permease [Frankia nepalensis]MBL7625795.1 ABC transporter permease [Frankia nepalensis]